MTAFWTSLIFIVLAEMGDKTQLLAMAFAARYRASLVLGGILAATAGNHLLAVVVGSYLTAFLPLQYIQLAAAASFILFGIWTLRGDTLQGEDRRFAYSPFWTVAVAFFLAEMGDKTQLATVALAARYRTILPVWLGTTSGMIVADAIGILAGIVLHKHLPQRFIKWGAALVFVGYGVFGIHENISEEILTPQVEIIGLSILFLLAYMILRGHPKEVPVPKISSD